MANASKGNVYRIDTTNTVLSGIRNVCAVKYIGAASGTATIKTADGTVTIWEHSGNVLAFEEVNLRLTGGIEVEVTNSAVVYLYVE